MTRDEYENITLMLAVWCGVDLRPANITEGDGFKYFMSKTSPRYHVPGTTTVGKYMRLVYDETIEDVLAVTKGSTVGFTTDLWTSIAQDGYVTVTAI